MANEPKLDKVTLSFQAEAALKQRLKKAAKDHKMKFVPYVTFVLSEAVKDVELDADDYEEIAKIIRKNEQRRHARRAGH